MADHPQLSQIINEFSGRMRIIPDAPLAPLIWFKSGGKADWLVEPAKEEDLIAFMHALPRDTPVFPLGLGSNLIIRDGGVRGLVIRLGKAFADMRQIDEHHIEVGVGAAGIRVASFARDCSIAGMEFLRGIPGTIGGVIRMNGGAYGREARQIVKEARLLLRSGDIVNWTNEDFQYQYRKSAVPEGAIILSALLQGKPGDREVIGREMARIAKAREESQPLRTKTGGSTFKNPQNEKAWRLVDAAGCRGLRVGDAQISEKHANFIINHGEAKSADIEALGEQVRERVAKQFGIDLQWEIQRIGEAKIVE